MFKYIEKKIGVVFCIEIEPASLQGLKVEPPNKIGSRNRDHSQSEMKIDFINFNNWLGKLLITEDVEFDDEWKEIDNMF